MILTTLRVYLMSKLARKLLIILLAAGSTHLFPCDVPVFRYALERWESEAFEVITLHRGSLSPENKQVVDWLYSIKYQLPEANFTIRDIDLNLPPDSSLTAMLKPFSDSGSPRLAVRFPRGRKAEQIIWSGPLTLVSARAIIDSPGRKEIAMRILDGQAAVFVLLESGDSQKDSQASYLLKSQLPGLKKSLTLPQTVNRPSANGAPELRVDFSFLSLSRSDPAEEVFIAMLLATEEDLGLYKDQPITIPVYGRGRALYALVGDGITPENIREACEFVLGPCACEVKQSNPGADLLMAVDWASRLKGSWVEEITLPQFEGLGSLARAAQTPASAGGLAAVARKEILPGRLRRNLLLALGLAAAVIGLASFKIWKIGKKDGK